MLQPGRPIRRRLRTILSEDIENELVAHAIDLQQRLCGMTPIDLGRLALQLADLEKLSYQFNIEDQMAGRKGLTEFLHLYPELSAREPEATNMYRAVAFNKPQVKRLSELLTTELVFAHVFVQYETIKDSNSASYMYAGSVLEPWH